jgi:hypothetical protein
MADRTPVARPTGRQRRPALSQTILNVAAVAVAVAALIWSALFYEAVRKHTIASASVSAGPATTATGASHTAPALVPVTTRTS